MESTLKTWETGRKIIADLIEPYSLEQLNHTPKGFSNNLIWNAGHVIAAQQSLIYRTSSLPLHVTDAFFELYKPGSKPTGNTTQQEVDEIKRLLSSLIGKAESDLQNGVFKTFTERTTITGFHLGNLNDAFAFNNFHEGLHFGMMMNIRKFL